MRTLTICQPYASLIIGWPGMHEAVRKPVENRKWFCAYTGPLLIHAGKSKEWLDSWDGPVPDDMPFGAILGAVDMRGCFTPDDIRRLPKLIDIRGNMHIEGPYCFVLDLPVRYRDPLPIAGKQGLWNAPAEILRGAFIADQAAQ